MRTVPRPQRAAPPQAAQAPNEALLEALRVVDRPQRENRDLAGLVGALQERVGTLQAQLALQAPKQSDGPEIAPGRDSDAAPPAARSLA